MAKKKRYKVMTLNMLTDGVYHYGKNRFPFRVIAIKKMLREYKPDLIGVQELTENMKRLFAPILEEYGMAGEKRGSAVSNEYSAILYRKDRFELLETKTYWLSETPDVKGSKIKYAPFPRIVTYGLFKDKRDGTVFTMFNTHLEEAIPSVRHRQAAILHTLVCEKQGGEFSFVTGDFNDIPGSETLSYIKEAGYEDTSESLNVTTLRSIIGTAIFRNKPIDHILISPEIREWKLQRITKTYSGFCPSDHYPLFMEFFVEPDDAE